MDSSRTICRHTQRTFAHFKMCTHLIILHVLLVVEVYLLVTLVPCARRLEGRRHARSFVTCQLSHVRAALGVVRRTKIESLFFLFFNYSRHPLPNLLRIVSEPAEDK